MRIESLALFLSVVAEGSITRAARSSYISQQGASAIIKSLEHEFGVTLFERRGASLQLTEAGARIAAEAESVVSAYRKLQTVAALGEGSRPDDGGPARIVTTPHALNVLSPIFDAYREVQGEKDPFILVEESIFDIVGAFPDLDPNALYVVNVPTFMETIIKRLGSSFEPLVVCELMLYCRSDSPFADRGMISRDELSEMNIACYNEALLIRLVQHLLKGVEGADIAMRTSNLSLLNRMISEPRTVTFIDSLSLFLNGVPDGDSCIPMENPVSFATGFLGPVRGPAAERFAAFFRRYLETVCSDYQKRFVLTWPPSRTQESAS